MKHFAPPSSHLLFVSGLKREAQIAHAPDSLAICGGAVMLRRRLEEAHARHRLTISFGICGGLDPSLRSGDIIIGTHVVSEGDSVMADEEVAWALAARLRAAGERVKIGVVAGVDAPVLTRASKAELRKATKAASVDMESQIAARFAFERKAPFAILRVVSDPAGRDLPPLVMKAVKADGSLDLGVVAFGVMRSPAQTRGLIHGARDSSAAFAALRRVRRLPGLFRGLGLAHL
ncbi:MAG TPA: phosphorylase [Roseiarcus sp.]